MKYRRPSRFRRIAKWVGLGVCVVILLTWACTIRSAIIYQTSHGLIGVGRGAVVWVEALYQSLGWDRVNATRVVEPLHRYNDYGFTLPQVERRVGWAVQSDGQLFKYKFPIRYQIPLWLPLVIVAIPTTILWRRDRRPRKGHCPDCGYNLTGNESGKCPECSTPVPKQETTA